VSRPVGGILSTLRRGWGGHPSERSTWGWQPEGMPDGPSVPRFDLAPGGVYRADRVTPAAGALLPHRFTLTCALPGGDAIGGLFSVALSCRSPRLAVSQHPALWSPDLPRPHDGRLALLSEPAAATRPAHRPHHGPTPGANGTLSAGRPSRTVLPGEPAGTAVPGRFDLAALTGWRVDPRSGSRPGNHRC
jgi:hypothetical protein